MTESLMERAKAMISIPENLNGSRQNLELRVPEIVERLVLESSGTTQAGWADHAGRVLRPLCGDKDESYLQAMNALYDNILNIYSLVASVNSNETPDMRLLFSYIYLYKTYMKSHKAQGVCRD